MAEAADGAASDGTAVSADVETAVVRRARRNRQASLGYEPALDGLRAVAVLAVLFFHARFGWAKGGFLGVSTFFTLSGFLITSLMLGEWRSSGAISLRGFYRRRFRRLLPASWMTLLLVIAMGAVGLWTSGQLRDLRGDVPWALAELVNWHFIAQDRTYGAQFEAPSPIEHFWSLAVEQQFYLVLPVVVLGALGWSQRRAVARGRGTREGPAGTPLRLLVGILVVAGVASAVLNGVLARGSVARAYFGTDTRLAELVIGALLACVGLAAIRGGTTRRRRGLDALGFLGLAGTVVLWSVATVPSTWLYPWGLLLTAAASTALIVGALQGELLGAVLSWSPFVALGRISYGVYLLHWPVFLWLTPSRVGWSQWPLFGLRMAVTLAASVVMFKLLEVPIRSGPRVVSRVAARAALPAAALIVLSTLVVTSDLPGPSNLEAAASAETTTTVPPAPVRVLVVGDETAASWELLGGTAGTEEQPLEVSVLSTPFCGIALGGYVQLSDGSVERDADRCGEVEGTWLEKIEAERPDVVVLSSALRDVANRRLDAEVPWEVPGSAALDDFLATEVREAIDAVTSTGAAVMVATAPHMSNASAAPAAVELPLPADPTRAALMSNAFAAAAEGAPGGGHVENEAARIDRWNEILRQAADASGAAVLEVATDVARWPGGEFDPQRRAPDGVGFTEVGMRDLADASTSAIAAVRPPVQRADPAADVAAEAPLPPAPPATPRRTAPAGSTADVLVVGDSVAFNIGYGLSEWADGNREIRVQSAGQLGCPIARGGQYRFLRDLESFGPDCDWAQLFPDWVATTDPEVAVLTSGIWEVVDRRLPGDDRFRNIGDPVVDRYLLAEMLSAIDTLAARGATVVLLTYPHFEAGRDQGYSDLPESDPARVDRLNEIMAEAVSLRPGVAVLVDFQAWLAAQPGGELDPAKRTDGLHFEDAFSVQIGQWLGPQLLELARSGP
jgi:peptidoglycan/LPS O-acetylase OafA/YrhL